MEDKGSNSKSKLPSRYVSVGPKSAPHRSYYYAMGLKEHEIYQPFVGVVSTWNESAPCNITLQDQAQQFYTILRMDGKDGLRILSNGGQLGAEEPTLAQIIILGQATL